MLYWFQNKDIGGVPVAKHVLPGTTLEMDRESSAEDFIQTLFAANGLVLSQVLELTGLSAHTVQNWVKRGFVNPPVAKKYSRDQFCAIVIINMLHPVIQIEHIRRMMDYVGGLRSDAPSLIYFTFVRTLTCLPEDTLGAMTDLEAIISGVLSGMELDEALAARLQKALHAMVLAHLSSVRKADAEAILATLD